MEQNRETNAVFGVRLDRVRDAPTRFGFAALAGSDRLWAGLLIGLPLAALLLTPVNDAFVSLAAGLPVGICLWLLWLSHEFVASQLTINADDRQLIRSKPYNRGQYSPIDIDDVDHVSIIRWNDVALVRFHYSDWLGSNPPDAAVPTSRIDELESRLEKMGLDVSVREVTLWSSPLDMIQARIVLTPAILLGTVVTVWALFGSEALMTDVVVVPLIVLLGYGLYGFAWTYRLRSVSE